jgi:hypothetical protein
MAHLQMIFPIKPPFIMIFHRVIQPIPPFFTWFTTSKYGEIIGDGKHNRKALLIEKITRPF